MKNIISALKANSEVSDYKINVHEKVSYELFFVKGKLETVRATDTCDKQVTVYVDHGEFKGDSQFFVYPSTTEAQLNERIAEAVAKAKLIDNKFYEIPGKDTGSFEVASNFSTCSLPELAAVAANTTFQANSVENAALNAVEVFINKHTERICNSRGLDKSQVRYDAMIEAIPTYNGSEQSVELYEQLNFGSMDPQVIAKEIAEKLNDVKARYEAVRPDFPIACDVVLGKLELATLFGNIARDLNYGTVYMHANLFKKGEKVQQEICGDSIGITMRAEAEGSIRSRKFDSDGMALTDIRVVENGEAVNYFGDNRYGQYLGEVPTGSLGCACVDAGTLSPADMTAGKYLEVVSMSGLQVDFFNDYIGGEVRLAYYHDGEKVTPVTGISISGKVSEVLKYIRLANWTAVEEGYVGPEKARLSQMTVF